MLQAGHTVLWSQRGDGAFVVTAPRAVLQKIAADLGVHFDPPPPGLVTTDAVKLRRVRTALADHYGGSMPSGWTRWLLEQYEFPFEVVFPKALDAGDLASKYDVIIFPSGVGPTAPTGAQGGRGGGGQGAGTGSRGSGNIPAEYEAMLGAYTAARTGPQLRRFLESGGTILAVGRSSMNLAELLQLPVSNHLVERSPDGSTQSIASEKYYVPGSVLRMAVDTTVPIAHGITNPVDVFFDNSPVFRLAPDAVMKGVRPVAWFDTGTPLRSGWAYGQTYLEGGVQVIDAAVGRGRLFLFAPEITFRAQPAGTFKFLFNGIYLAARGPGSAGTNTAVR
jgi:hypothetical protein